MRTLPLFEDSDDESQIHSARAEPLVWLKELHFFHTLNEDAEVIRDPITFRRGLNIIATAKNPGTDSRPVGHSVGKSLLMRLIRYCLGEPGFAEKRVRQAICNRFPHGYIIANFIVDGAPWYVARPIGLDSPSSASWASPTTLDSLYDRDHRQPFQSFADLLHRVVIEPLPRINLPKARRELRWVDLIAWLCPDQKCAHKSHVNWRPGGADLFNRGLTVEDNHIIVRTVMDLLTIDDSGLIGAHKELLSEQGRLNRSIDLKTAVVESGRRDLLVDLPSNFEHLDREILAGHALAYAIKNQNDHQALLDDEMDGDPLEDWRENNDEIQQEIGTLRAKIQHAQTDKDVAQAVLDSIDDGSHATQIAANADMGDFCHLFNTKKEAVACGCPGEITKPKPGYNPMEERRKAENQEIVSRCEEQIEILSEQLWHKEEKAKQVQLQFRRVFTDVENRRKPLREQIATFKQLKRDAKRFRSLCEDLTTLKNKKNSLKKTISESLEQRRSADNRYRVNRQTLVRCFNEALRRIGGSIERGTIEINARGIRPRPEEGFQSEGEAMGTTTILAFDLGCMLASMTGLGNHPRMLLDDSPRDADMEPPMYQQLLKSIADLEQLSVGEPAFQYILTTTTRPSKELGEPPYVRLTLDAHYDDGLLLRERF